MSSDILEQFKACRDRALADIALVGDLASLEDCRIKYLARKGEITALLSQVGKLPRELKPEGGKLANQVKKAVNDAFDQRRSELENSGPADIAPICDVTLPGKLPRLGGSHVITQTIDELLELFGRMGFSVAYGPEIEDEYHNFVALNIDESHPARDPLDNFYIDDTSLLRSQTSPVQIRVMEKQSPPIRIVVPGRVFRPDTVDATHMFMFHQIEALVVDEGVSMADLKSTIDQFLKAFIGQEVTWRFRPHFFPFTEPSAEVDLLLIDKNGNEGWVEMGGCGMVDPNVFEAVGYDPEKYTGWAFGFGIERLAMRKYDIRDIRLLFENDLRFLRQF